MTTGPQDLDNNAVAALIAGLSAGVLIGWNTGVRLASRVWRQILDERQPPPPPEEP